jgi:hypothetical protein
LWWRLVPRLGPTALDGDAHSAAWPALVAAVDEASRHDGWPPQGILSAGLAGIPQDGTLTGADVADALVLRIAMLTDPPPDNNPETGEGSGYQHDDPDTMPPEDLDQLYLDHRYDDLAELSDEMANDRFAPTLRARPTKSW